MMLTSGRPVNYKMERITEMSKKKDPEKKESKGGKLIQEFKEFISRGSVIDLAVGVIVGGAFTTIVNSLVDDIIMPVIGIITGGINFSSLKFTIKLPEELIDVDPATINYGLFIQNVINFLLTALVIFFLVKGINAFRKKKDEEPAPEPEPSDEVKLLTDIRDLLSQENDGKSDNSKNSGKSGKKNG